MRTYHMKVCQRCGKDFQPTGGKQKYCHECRLEVEAEYNREHVRRWNRLHPDKHLSAVRNWRKANPEKARALVGRYYAAHPEKSKERTYKWRKNKPADALAAVRKYAKAHPEAIRAIQRKRKAKRRVLGFVAMNEPFEACEGHHLDKDHVVFIPKTLHRSICHNVWTGKNMDRINVLAYEWLAKETQNANGKE